MTALHELMQLMARASSHTKSWETGTQSNAVVQPAMQPSLVLWPLGYTLLDMSRSEQTIYIKD